MVSEGSVLWADVPGSQFIPTVEACSPNWLLLVGGEVSYEEQGFKEMLLLGGVRLERIPLSRNWP